MVRICRWKIRLCLSFWNSQTHGLKTSVLVWDGCPVNLTMIKLSHGFSGAYSVLPADSTGDQFAIKAWFVNPYNPPNLIYWMICPTHQVRQYLYAKYFYGFYYSWKTWVMLYYPPRVLAQNSSNDEKITVVLVGVPLLACIIVKLPGLNNSKPARLKEVHRMRDAWTKLNVSPAKIMQVQWNNSTSSFNFINHFVARSSIGGIILVHSPRATTTRCQSNRGDIAIFKSSIWMWLFSSWKNCFFEFFYLKKYWWRIPIFYLLAVHFAEWR